MDAMANLLTRRSIRSYRPDMLPREVIEKIAEAGTYAPTGMNRQTPIIVAVTNKALRDRMSRLNAAVLGMDSDPFYGAPVVLVVLAEKGRRTYIHDGALVMGNLMLPPTPWGWEAAGSTAPQRPLRCPTGRSSWSPWALRVTTRASATASWATPTATSPHRPPARRDGCITRKLQRENGLRRPRTFCKRFLDLQKL